MCVCVCVCVCSVTQSCPTLCSPMDCSLPGMDYSLSMAFSRQDYLLPLPTLGNLPDPGIKPTSLATPGSANKFFTTSTTWEAPYKCMCLCV